MLCNFASQDAITIYKGDSLDVEFTVSYEDGTLVDLTTFNARFVVFETSISKNSTNPAQITILTPATAGKLRVHLVPADTAALPNNHEYTYDAELYDGSGNVYTFAQNTFKVV